MIIFSIYVIVTTFNNQVKIKYVDDETSIQCVNFKHRFEQEEIGLSKLPNIQ
jgi:hypothetical protein